MNKRTIGITVASVAVLLAAGAIYAATRTTTTPQYWAKAKATKATVACLSANAKLSVPASTRNGIEMAAISYLIDVPAGTNVDVRFATYSPTKVMGSDYYPAKYGTYNFTATKENDGWHITSFLHCH
jgi:hypothetical protein